MLVGGLGQIGEELTPALTHVYGKENILVTDIHEKAMDNYLQLNAFDYDKMLKTAKDFNPSIILHLPALLSASSEKDHFRAININNDTFLNAVKVSLDIKCKLFCPSSISAYGFSRESDRFNINEETYQRPKFLYGVTKVYMELLGNYFAEKHGLDFRSIRYPGVLSSVKPFGGTTDFAISQLTSDDLCRR
jgi:threonine 3-dehydrogenase